MLKYLALLFIWVLCNLAQVLISLRFLYEIFINPDKAWLIAISIDDSSNVAGNGKLGQTISYRAATAQKAGAKWGCILCKLLDLVNQGHCTRALTDSEQNLS